MGESLALETEKALATLLCFNNDRHLRTKFIEGCLANLANNRCIIVSLRLLPKLFVSFQQFRPIDTHHITMWAEKHHKMMYHFFNNIKYYAKTYAESLANVSKNGNDQQQLLQSPHQQQQLLQQKSIATIKPSALSSVTATNIQQQQPQSPITNSGNGNNSNGNSNNASNKSLYTHKMQVSVRLHFLSSIYSAIGSPKTFR